VIYKKYILRGILNMNEINGTQVSEISSKQPALPPNGKTLIKVVAIILIISGSISLLIGLITLIGSFAIVGVINILIILLALVRAALTLIFGIRCVKFAGDAAKAQNVITMGIILCAMRLLDLIVGLAFATELGSSLITGIIVGLIFPFLLIIGGNMNKQSAPMY
jgi:hypothetical protein